MYVLVSLLIINNETILFLLMFTINNNSFYIVHVYTCSPKHITIINIFCIYTLKTVESRVEPLNSYLPQMRTPL